MRVWAFIGLFFSFSIKAGLIDLTNAGPNRWTDEVLTVGVADTLLEITAYAA